MVSFGVLVVGVLVLYAVSLVVNGLRENIEKAKRANLPYMVVFVSPYNKLWQVFHVPCVALIKAILPESWWEDWIFVMTADWSYRLNQDPWERLGETFLVVSPGRILMFTCNAEAIRQVAARRDDFPKPTETYKLLALFGENVLTTEGAFWRMHRKVSSTSFNERNAAYAFAEAINQTKGMVQMWRGCHGGEGDDRGDSRIIKTLPYDTMTLTLNVIGSVGFGLRFRWPGQAPPDDCDPKMLKYTALKPGEGHTMTFHESLATVLDKILTLLLVPTWLLGRLPLDWAKKAYEARDNYDKYMQEFLRDKKEEVRLGDNQDRGMDIMGALVRAKYGCGGGEGGEGGDGEGQGGFVDAEKGSLSRTNSGFEEKPAGTGSARSRRRTPSPSSAMEAGGIPERNHVSSRPLACPQLADSHIIGNAFIIIVAGHETTASALHFSLVELANNPAAQRALQADVDRIFGGSSPDSCLASSPQSSSSSSSPRTQQAPWSYEACVSGLLSSMPGAVINETLRMMPAVVEIPKEVTPNRDQTLVLDGEEHVIPASATVALAAVAAHRNPRYWPANREGVLDVNDWVAERWFRKAADGANTNNNSSSSNRSTAGSIASDEEDDCGSTGTASGLFRPVRGSYVPFSDGARSCLGRRIAQVELVAALAVIFQRYSIELAVEELIEGVEAHEVERMAPAEKATLYEKARGRSRETLRKAVSVITLKLPGDMHVPVRIVRRGRERFLNVVDT